MDKDEILERYLNTVYFGRGAYGIEAAAGRLLRHDGRRARRSRRRRCWSGCSAPPRAPTPTTDPDDGQAPRRDSVLDAMAEVGRHHRGRGRGRRRRSRPRRHGPTSRRSRCTAGVGAHVVEWIRARGHRAVRRRGRVRRRLHDPHAPSTSTTSGPPRRPSPACSTEPADPAGRAGGARRRRRRPGHGRRARLRARCKVDLARGHRRAAARAGSRARRSSRSCWPPRLDDGQSRSARRYPAPPTHHPRHRGGPVDGRQLRRRGATASIDLDRRPRRTRSTPSTPSSWCEVGSERVVDDGARRSGVDQRARSPTRRSSSAPRGLGARHGRRLLHLRRDGRRIDAHLIDRVDGRRRRRASSTAEPSRGERVIDAEHRPGRHPRAAAASSTTAPAPRPGSTARRPARPAPPRTTATPGSPATRPTTPPPCGWATPRARATPMDDVHGRAVTGGSFPAEIWKRFMDAALAEVPKADFAPPPTELLRPPSNPPKPPATDPAPAPAASVERCRRPPPPRRSRRRPSVQPPTPTAAAGADDRPAPHRPRPPPSRRPPPRRWPSAPCPPAGPDRLRRPLRSGAAAGDRPAARAAVRVAGWAASSSERSSWCASEASQARTSDSSWRCWSTVPLRTACASSPSSSHSHATVAASPLAVPLAVGLGDGGLEVVEVHGRERRAAPGLSRRSLRRWLGPVPSSGSRTRSPGRRRSTGSRNRLDRRHRRGVHAGARRRRRPGRGRVDLGALRGRSHPGQGPARAGARLDGAPCWLPCSCRARTTPSGATPASGWRSAGAAGTRGRVSYADASRLLRVEPGRAPRGRERSTRRPSPGPRTGGRAARLAELNEGPPVHQHGAGRVIGPERDLDRAAERPVGRGSRRGADRPRRHGRGRIGGRSIWSVWWLLWNTGQHPPAEGTVHPGVAGRREAPPEESQHLDLALRHRVARPVGSCWHRFPSLAAGDPAPPGAGDRVSTVRREGSRLPPACRAPTYRARHPRVGRPPAHHVRRPSGDPI